MLPAFMMALTIDAVTTEKHVRFNLRGTAPQTFADVLNIEDQVQSDSFECLMGLVGK